MKDLDESDTKSTVFCFLEIDEMLGEISENFDGLFYFPMKILFWSLVAATSRKRTLSRKCSAVESSACCIVCARAPMRKEGARSE